MIYWNGPRPLPPFPNPFPYTLFTAMFHSLLWQTRRRYIAYQEVKLWKSSSRVRWSVVNSEYFRSSFFPYLPSSVRYSVTVLLARPSLCHIHHDSWKKFYIRTINICPGIAGVEAICSVKMVAYPLVFAVSADDTDYKCSIFVACYAFIPNIMETS
jgi:hypothetical protein